MTVPAHPWELRADVMPLEAAAQRWTEVGALVARRGDELVEAARRATEGWDAAAAESYEEHRRQVLAHLDHFTTLAERIADSLRASAGLLASSQKELDQAWTTVADVPHEVVGESRHLVFRPSEDEERGRVTHGQAEAADIRRRLAAALDQESARLRAARAELVTVRTELLPLTGGSFPVFDGAGGEVSGVGTLVATPSTSVPGSSQAGAGGVAALPPLTPVAVTVPDLTGVSAAALAPLAASGAAAAAGRGRSERPPLGTPPVGAMGGGAMAARAGTMSRGMASGRGGPARMPGPKPERTAAEEAAARAAREKEALREAKRAALEQKRAERAARKAERAAARDGQPAGRSRDGARRDDAQDDGQDDGRDDAHDDAEGPEQDEELDAELDAAADGRTGQPAAERRQAVRVVHEAAPESGAGAARR
ncbi:hypothetical protein [Nocardioides sp. zg-1228]|uniref:hypothetical protein n=1 Tax=Nocardioides sp. zg-1228 TaxID=2763008 RepID=UPI001642BBF6|nr:hypothetical protein [Nocardioides sp. zg-1228]MBC2931715.1 hypothetical protein [Nocardioides sp. zg-1228]QSF57302.1 hypothetical protein JX575_17385 [Nocardioides sp. zg-1228]